MCARWWRRTFLTTWEADAMGNLIHLNPLLMQYVRQWQPTEIWKCLMPWPVQGRSKNVPKPDLTKRRRTCCRNHSETKNASKNEPREQGPKQKDMLQFHANNSVLVTIFSAHLKYAHVRRILTNQCFQNMEISTVFFLTTDVIDQNACKYTRGKQSAGMFMKEPLLSFTFHCYRVGGLPNV